MPWEGSAGEGSGEQVRPSQAEQQHFRGCGEWDGLLGGQWGEGRVRVRGEGADGKVGKVADLHCQLTPRHLGDIPLGVSLKILPDGLTEEGRPSLEGGSTNM